jgi:hypothetical protein
MLELIRIFFYLDVPGHAEAPVEGSDGAFDMDEESLAVEKLQRVEIVGVDETSVNERRTGRYGI